METEEGPSPPSPPSPDHTSSCSLQRQILQEPTAPMADDPPPFNDVDSCSYEEEALAPHPSPDTDPQEMASGPLPDLDAVVKDDAASHDPQKPGVEEAPLPAAPVLTDDLRDQIVRQVEYYFSDANLATDKFMLKYVKKYKEGLGFVPIPVISSFKRMKKLVQDLSLIEAALRTSSQLVVSGDGKKVRRLHPLPVTEIKDTKTHTVIVENLPDDYSTESIKKLFGNIGKITSIAIRDPHSLEDSVATKKGEFAISSKLHVLVEYETTEAAESAVASLNDEKNWRSGMRVELLIKRMEKYGLIQRGNRENLSGKDDNQTPDVTAGGQKLKSTRHQDETAETEEEHSSAAKGRRQSRGRGRGRGHLPQNTNGQGHGRVPPSCSSEGASKPIAGPRMPDGTRGFTIGRGKPASKDQNV